MRRSSTPQSTTEPAASSSELTGGLDAIGAVLDRACDGDLEARVAPLTHPGLNNLRARLNRLLDVTDAYTRESSATMAAAAAGQYHRHLLTRGLPGVFGDGARRIDGARAQLEAAAEHAATQERTRSELIEQVVEIAGQVAAASVEFGATAETLAASTRASVDDADRALATVEVLERSSEQIEAAVTLIRHVADSTRLLALNATIEAARAGNAGRAFAVVAGEVKSLADSVAAASDEIFEQVAATQQASGDAARDIAKIAGLIRDMNVDVTGVAEAAGDNGLARLAQELRVQVSQVAAR